MTACGAGQREIRKFIAPELVLGEDAAALAGQYARNLGVQRALLVTDPGVSAAGWAGAVASSLRAAGVEVEIFDGVAANPNGEQVSAGAKRYREARCDGVVAVGGGSPIDAAKGIGVVVTNGGHILDYEGVDRIESPIPPIVCVPTTVSSADVSQFAIINDGRRRTKLAIISRALVPDVSLLDPCTLSTLSAQMMANTGMDALTHAVEAYVSNASSPVTDVMSLEAVRIVASELGRCVDDRANGTARAAMVHASALAGMAFSNAILGVVHALAHSLGGFLGCPHGQCNALLLEHVVRFNFEAARERYFRVAEAVGVELRGLGDIEVREAMAAAIGRLRRRVGIDGSLATLGVSRSDIPTLARHALLDPCIATNPRAVTERDLAVILETAL